MKKIPLLTDKDKQRFWEKVDKRKDDECWNWLASKPNGYGQFGIKRIEFKAHRIVWELTNGTIPDNLCVLHKCDTPSCCNPKHLFLGTQGDNMRDMSNKKRQRFQKCPETKLFGEDNPSAKLTNETRQVIRLIKNSNNISGEQLGRLFSVSGETIRRICKQ